MTLVIAHRGASAAHPPGNTLEAFRAARDLGADWVELDVRPSADGALVVHHDAELPDGRPVASVAAGDRPAFVPLLSEALDACDGMGVNVEIKREPGAPWDDPDLGPTADVLALLEALGRPERFLVTSFDPAVLDRVRSLAPGLPSGVLCLDPRADPDPLALAADGGHVALNPWDPLVDAALVDRAHERGLAVNVWTVDDPARMAELAGVRRRRDHHERARRGAGGPRRLTPRTPVSAGHDQVEHVGLVAQLERLGLAQVVAVDLVRERSVALDGRSGDTGFVGHVAAAAQAPPRAERRAHQREQRQRTQVAHGDERQRVVEPGVGGDREGPGADEGVGVGVETDRELPVVDGGTARDPDREPGRDRS